MTSLNFITNCNRLLRDIAESQESFIAIAELIPSILQKFSKKWVFLVPTIMQALKKRKGKMHKKHG